MLEEGKKRNCVGVRRNSASIRTREKLLKQKPRSKSVCSPGTLMSQRRDHIVEDIFEDDETGEQKSTEVSMIEARYEENSMQLTSFSNYQMDEITRKADIHKKRASVMVTSGALAFILLAAALVTTSFLMSPVIEEIFGKKINKSKNAYYA